MLENQSHVTIEPDPSSNKEGRDTLSTVGAVGNRLLVSERQLGARLPDLRCEEERPGPGRDHRQDSYARGARHSKRVWKLRGRIVLSALQIGSCLGAPKCLEQDQGRSVRLVDQALSTRCMAASLDGYVLSRGNRSVAANLNSQRPVAE